MTTRQNPGQTSEPSNEVTPRVTSEEATPPTTGITVVPANEITISSHENMTAPSTEIIFPLTSKYTVQQTVLPTTKPTQMTSSKWESTTEHLVSNTTGTAVTGYGKKT